MTLDVGPRPPFDSHLEWYERGRLAPFVVRSVAAGPFGWVEAKQPAGDMSDPPIDQLVVGFMTQGPALVHADFGAGRFSKRSAPGDLFVIPPNVPTSIHVDHPHAIAALSIPSADALAWLGPNARAPLDFGHLHATSFREPLVLAAMQRLGAELTHGDALARLFVDAAACLIVRALAAQSRPARDTPAGAVRLSPWKLRKALELLNERLADDVSLDELSNEVGLSMHHFARAFKASTGLAPHRYHVQLRLERARTLLETTEWSIAEIAVEVGYRDSSALSRAFRRELGVLPSAFRRSCREPHVTVAGTAAAASGRDRSGDR